MEANDWSRLGFSDGEGRVYQAILHSDEATLQFIHEQTGIERRNVYDIINKLIHKGLLTYISENKHKVYRTTNPAKIADYLQRQKQQVEEQEQLLGEQMPQLLRTYESAKPSVDTQIYRGVEGLRTLFDEMLDYQDHYFIGGNWGVRKYLGARWHDRWENKRVERKIWWHDILTKKLIHPPPESRMKFYESRILPDEFNSPNVMFIYGNNVVNLYWGEPLLAVRIESAEIAKNYLNYFKFLWKKLPPRE